MKKIAFMFVAAAMFAACGGQKAEAPVEETTPEAEPVEVAIDSAKVWAIVGDTTGMPADTIAAKFQAAVDSLNAATEAAAEEAAPAEEVVE